MGHSVYGLTDEYGSGDGLAPPPGEPSQPNATRDTNRTTTKWRALIKAATPMPSQCNPACTASTCVAPTLPPPADAVGTYEGANYSDCGVYRPLANCKMRELVAPFCPVCAGVIEQTLAPFQPAPTA